MGYANIIGRTDEIMKLERLYNSRKSEFIAIYGRRRVGKSFLVNEVFGKKILFKAVTQYYMERICQLISTGSDCRRLRFIYSSQKIIKLHSHQFWNSLS